jgi:hypothetical protein
MIRNAVILTAILLLSLTPLAEAERRTDPHGPMRRSYDAVYVTPLGGVIGLSTVNPSGFDTRGGGATPAGGAQITCQKGQVTDLPADQQPFWFDGATLLGPKWAGQRCIRTNAP